MTLHLGRTAAASAPTESLVLVRSLNILSEIDGCRGVRFSKAVKGVSLKFTRSSWDLLMIPDSASRDSTEVWQSPTKC